MIGTAQDNKERKREEAKTRKEGYENLSIEERIKIAEDRVGSSTKELNRLLKKLKSR